MAFLVVQLIPSFLRRNFRRDNMKTIFFLLFLLSGIHLNAQTRTYHLGLKAEFYGYTSKEVREYSTYSKKFNLSNLPSIYIIASKDVSELFTITLKPGIIFQPDNFGTFELGLFGSFDFPENPCFIIGGINTHFNKEPDDRRNVPDILYFIVFGGGYRLTKYLSVDLAFHQSLNKTYRYTYGKFPSEAFGPSELFNMIKIGFAAAF